MDQQGFRNLLQARNLNDDQIEASIAMAERFEAYLDEPGRTPSAGAAGAFSQRLIEEGNNTRDNYLALIRYCYFIGDNEMYVAFLELVDGGEVGENLYRGVGESFGAEIQAEVFAGIGVASYGTPNTEKPATLHPVIERLEARVGKEACIELLSPSLRDLPDEYYLPERQKYRQLGDIDAYLRLRKDEFMADLEACQRENRLFFSQEITDEVLDFVRNDPEMGGGLREGKAVYETKIPYMTRQYLAESDPKMKRYYACHCPWVREAIKNEDVKLAEIFCQCSGGYHKKPFEVVFEQPLKVDVLESVIKGDDRCRFAIHLPDKAFG
jgi:hypothetical protein